MNIEQIHREYMQTMHEVRRFQILHRRNHEAYGREFGFLRMIEKFQNDHPEVPGIYVNDLASCTGITKSGVSKSLNSLEQRGLITRTIDPHNRRNTFVSLTQGGRLFCRQQHERLNMVITRVSEAMGEEHFLEVMTGIREVLQIMERELPACAADGQENIIKEEPQCDPFCDT